MGKRIWKFIVVSTREVKNFIFERMKVKFKTRYKLTLFDTGFGFLICEYYSIKNIEGNRKYKWEYDLSRDK